MGNAQKKAAQHSSKGPYTSSGPVKKVHWDGPGLPAPPGKPILIPGEEDSHPDVVGMRWERSPSCGGSAIIGYHVEHRKMGSPNWVRSAPVLCTFPELTLSGLEPGWRYQFRIRAQNAFGLSEPSELSDPLTVTLQRTASIAPRFDTEPKDCAVLEGEQAEFSVVYMGIPTPKVSWLKDGFEIFSSRRTTIKTDSGKSTLVIHKTLLDDEGEIKCSATNRAGHISTRAKLMVEAPPHVRLLRQYDDGLLFEQGETIRLKATNGGRPPPSITWYHNNEIIIVDERHNFESITDNETILKIQDAKREDRGEYSIRAINKLGEDVVSFLVTVTDRPAAPGKALVTAILGRSVTLSWKEPEDDGGCKIGTYIVEYYRIGWDVWLKAVSCRKTTVTLNDLIEGSEYRFRVKAENPYGLSDPSEESDILFIPDPKRGIIEPNMRAKSASNRDILRGRNEKRRTNLNEPSQRTRSLNRDEASYRDTTQACHYSASSQQLLTSASSPKELWADNQVKFSVNITNTENNEPKQQWSKEILPQHEELEVQDRDMSPKTAVVITPNFDDSGGQKSFLESRVRIASSPQNHRLASPTIGNMSKIDFMESIENYESETSPSPLFDRRRSSSEIHDANMSLRTIQSEDEENMLHDSSEFMLVLYPDEEDNQQYQGARMKIDSQTTGRDGHLKRSTSRKHLMEHKMSINESEYSEQEDLLPPPMSLSLPELFTTDHQIVEVIREAVSSTELLHERAMERFYRAIEVEKSTEQNRKKFEVSYMDGQILSDCKSDNDTHPHFNQRTRSVHRRFLNSGNNSNTWLLKRDRRRSSEGQAKIPMMKAPNVFITAPLENVSSDPNLLISSEMLAPNVELNTGIGGSVERLRRWHEPGLDLSNEKTIAEIINKENRQNKDKEELQKLPDLNLRETSKVEEEYDEVAPDIGEILAEDSVETSGVSSEGESTDSEDLKQLKARIMAIPVEDEEDTYHPSGRMVMHIDSEIPPPVPPHRILLHDFSSRLPDRTNLSPTNLIQNSSSSIQPKSILKKRTEPESLLLNQFGRSIPPEKPVRKSLPIYDDSNIDFPNSSKSMTSLEYSNDLFAFETNISLSTSIPTSTSIITSTSKMDADLDKEAVISAGEAAIIKRRQMRHGSKTILSSEDNEEEQEEKMAVVSHYTEIVQQYSNPEIRQRSLSRDREQRFFENSLEYGVVTSDQNAQSSIIKERPRITLGKLMPSKIITSIPPVIPSIPIQKAKPISPTECNSRFGTLSNKLNTIEPEISSIRGKSRKQELVYEPGRSMKNIVEDSRNTSFSQMMIENRSSSRIESRPSSRNESPICRSRNSSRDEGSQLSSTIRTSNNMRNSQPSSRSNSNDRSRANTPTDIQAERLQRALENKKDRLRRTFTKDESEMTEEEVEVKNIMLAMKAELKVRTIISYVTDVVLLLAATYVYLFKKEILAVPIIGLLLYRYIQQEIRNWIPNR